MSEREVSAVAAPFGHGRVGAPRGRARTCRGLRPSLCLPPLSATLLSDTSSGFSGWPSHVPADRTQGLSAVRRSSGRPRGAPGGGAAAGSRRSRPDAPLLPGNLLSSLMGSSEQEGEDSQDDGSPIELD